MKQEGRFIRKSIRSYYRGRLIRPLLLLLLTVVLALFTPIYSMINPIRIPSSASADVLLGMNGRYIAPTMKDLYFTGYVSERFNETYGYYYYTKWGDTYLMVLLAPETCEMGISYIDELSITAEVQESASELNDIFNYLAADLSWTFDGISANMSHILLSEPAAETFLAYLTRWLFVLTHIAGWLILFLTVVFWTFPAISPAVWDLLPFGNPVKMLDEAEEELETMPQLATGDLFITEHYLIVMSVSGVSLVPISEIRWVYKYAPVRQIFGWHLKVVESLHIVAKSTSHVSCPLNESVNLDGVIEYLQEANHNIRIGYTEANRQYTIKQSRRHCRKSGAGDGSV